MRQKLAVRARTHTNTRTRAHARAGERQTCQRHVSAHISLTPSVAVHPRASWCDDEQTSSRRMRQKTRRSIRRRWRH